MTEIIDFHIPDCEEFRNGYEAYERENLGPIYFDALSIISRNWGEPSSMARGIQRIINGWNRFYSHFDFDRVVDCIERNLNVLTELRERNISTFSEKDEETVETLYYDFLEALKIERKGNDVASPVSVAKALNPMAPNFLPIWDSNIAIAYECFYFYIDFCKKMKLMVERLATCIPGPDDRSLLKRIDEYNYSKYTRNWI